MSATNHTTNYNLPQFLGTDKPTWLTDVNNAMSAIDTQMKANADSATGADTKATTANNAIGTLTNLETTAKTDLVSAINEVNTNAGTAQNTANTAIGSANDTATALAGFMQKFNLSAITNGTLDRTTTTGTVHNYLSLAQDSTGSIFKMYGTFQVNPNSSASKRAVEGLSGYYGVDTGLILSTAPTTAYIVKCAGVSSNNDASNTKGVVGYDFAVGTDGRIYIDPQTTNSNLVPDGSGRAMRIMFHPSIYFNVSFGDTPTPNA